MEMPDLLRVWSAVPRDKLHALDSKLAKACSVLPLHMFGLPDLCQALRSAPKVDEMPLQSAFLQQKLMTHCRPSMYVNSLTVKKSGDPGFVSRGGAGLKLAGAAGLCKVGSQAAGGLRE